LNKSLVQFRHENDKNKQKSQQLSQEELIQNVAESYESFLDTQDKNKHVNGAKVKIDRQV
jgi:hypothetical protein